MINRCRVKMSQNGLYKLGDSPQKRARSNLKKRTFVSFVSCLGNLYERTPPWIWIPMSSNSESIQLYDTCSYVIILKIRISHCQIHLGPVFWPTLYKIHCIGLLGPRHRINWAWTSNRDLTIIVENFKKVFGNEYKWMIKKY